MRYWLESQCWFFMSREREDRLGCRSPALNLIQTERLLGCPG